MKLHIQNWGDPVTLALNLRIKRNKLQPVPKKPKVTSSSNILFENAQEALGEVPEEDLKW
jgi:hypothetical protein